jgi:antitoxin component YwqK of YwqJK toxin-antitoxin module
MIKLGTGFLNLLFLLSLNLSAQDIDCSRINKIDGKYYIDEYEILFTGTCVSYYENGIVSFRASYMLGEPYGLFDWWYDNGQKSKEITYTYINGKSFINGKSYVWFSNGQLMIKEKFKNGLRDGEWFEYDSSGKQIKYGVYMDGEFISGDSIQVPHSALR